MKYNNNTFNFFTKQYLGGYDGTYYDAILEFDPLLGQWELVERTIRARAEHAVSVIDFESELCL